MRGAVLPPYIRVVAGCRSMQNQTAVAIFLLCAMQVARLAGRVGISGLVVDWWITVACVGTR